MQNTLLQQQLTFLSSDQPGLSHYASFSSPANKHSFPTFGNYSNALPDSFRNCTIAIQQTKYLPKSYSTFLKLIIFPVLELVFNNPVLLHRFKNFVYDPNRSIMSRDFRNLEIHIQDGKSPSAIIYQGKSYSDQLLSIINQHRSLTEVGVRKILVEFFHLASSSKPLCLQNFFRLYPILFTLFTHLFQSLVLQQLVNQGSVRDLASLPLFYLLQKLKLILKITDIIPMSNNCYKIGPDYLGIDELNVYWGTTAIKAQNIKNDESSESESSLAEDSLLSEDADCYENTRSKMQLSQESLIPSLGKKSVENVCQKEFCEIQKQPFFIKPQSSETPALLSSKITVGSLNPEDAQKTERKMFPHSCSQKTLFSSSLHKIKPISPIPIHSFQRVSNLGSSFSRGKTPMSVQYRPLRPVFESQISLKTSFAGHYSTNDMSSHASIKMNSSNRSQIQNTCSRLSNQKISEIRGHSFVQNQSRKMASPPQNNVSLNQQERSRVVMSHPLFYEAKNIEKGVLIPMQTISFSFATSHPTFSDRTTNSLNIMGINSVGIAQQIKPTHQNILKLPFQVNSSGNIQLPGPTAYGSRYAVRNSYN